MKARFRGAGRVFLCGRGRRVGRRGFGHGGAVKGMVLVGGLCKGGDGMVS